MGIGEDENFQSILEGKSASDQQRYTIAVASPKTRPRRATHPPFEAANGHGDDWRRRIYGIDNPESTSMGMVKDCEERFSAYTENFLERRSGRLGTGHSGEFSY